jgi:hypothetical protein
MPYPIVKARARALSLVIIKYPIILVLLDLGITHVMNNANLIYRKAKAP